MRLQLVLLCSVASLWACSESFLEPRTSADVHVDDRLALTGRVCTKPPDPSGFPVKVVFIVDQSGSMCVSDPPGSQESGGFCEMYATVPPGVTQPARVRALNQLIGQLSAQPNVQMAVVPFESNVKGVWPALAGSGSSRFSRPNASLTTRVQTLQAELGKGTDYQGALAYAYTLIASDIADVQRTSPEQLPRTRYVVVFLTDGTPYPRCAATDDLTNFADPDHPELLWADSSGSGDFCNQIDSEDIITGFVSGTDRNQNYQLFNYVKQLMELKDQYNIGDIRMHSVLLFNEEAVRACGPICQDLYGTYPNTAPAEYPQAAKKIARWLLQQFAQRGNGVYQEFNNSDINQLSLGALDYSSLAARNVMKTLTLQALSSEAGDVNRQVDTDGEGLPDELDNDFSNKTNKYLADSDDDGFSDAFEVRRHDEGFRADQKDGRGCDPGSPLTPGCTVSDTDGDGLSQYGEEYAKTRSTLVDSDGDGVPDGLEVRYGLDPLAPTASGLDTDGDGADDAAEIRAGSNPIKRDKPFQDKNAYQYDLQSEVQADGRVCYDFTVSNIQLVTPPSRAGLRQGFNLFKLWFGESPESGVATDYGVWRAACAWAQYDPPSVREPAGPQVEPFVNANFLSPQALYRADHYDTKCVGISPSQDARR
jgi:hypothetical protein